MINSKNTTKEKILSVALDMFSTRGYSSVSIRDICKSIGIKESSIYYHFTNKKAIFDELLLKVDELIMSMKNSFNMALSLATEVNLDAFVNAGRAYVENFMLEDKIYKIINMLNIEKNTNIEASNYYTKFLFETPLQHHQQVFTTLKEKGILVSEEPCTLAAEYQAIIIYIFLKYFSSFSLITDECRLIARNELTDMLTRFYSRYFLKGDSI